MCVTELTKIVLVVLEVSGHVIKHCLISPYNIMRPCPYQKVNKMN